MRRLASYYANLLDALTSAPSTQPITQLELLGSSERARILGAWSGAGRRVGYDVPVHKLISRVAAERPDAIAVSAPSATNGTQRLTYADVERRARALAHRLRGLGVRDGAVVAL